jgi:hypothetical protein
MIPSVPSYVWLVVPGAELTLIALLVAAVRRHLDAGAAAGVAVLLAGWFATAATLSGAGAFAGPGLPPPIALGVLPPILIGGLALAASRRLREAALAIPQAWLVGVQVTRILGAVFVLLLARGILPARFALPAGWGDVAVGAAAPFVAWGLATGRRWARPAAVGWNVLGLLDLANAVTIGALSAAGVFADAPSTEAMARLPLSLVPTYGVPIFVLLHVVSLLALRGSAATAAKAGRGFAGPASPAAAQRGPA